MSIISNIKTYLATPAHTVNSNYHIVAIALGAAVYLILAVLQPFGISDGPTSKYIYLLGFPIITYLGSMLPTAIMHRIYKTDIEEGRFSNGKNIAAFMLSVLLIMVGNFLYFKVLNPTSPTLPLLWSAIWQTIIISVLLLGVYFAFDNARLRRELERINKINQKLSQKSNAPAAPIIKKPEPQAKPSSTDIDPEALLYIESDKNYCKITTESGTTVIRSTLTTLENQLKPFDYVMRCHRAFLVNMTNVEGIEGSASNGYHLKIKNHPTEVPVSRTYISAVLQYFEG
ncbi:MAG: LytTR family transcriptional regulator [Bacteroidales bacterium]|nr:LytTR family transcriptional regulator [Bacteroidales bacterium]